MSTRQIFPHEIVRFTAEHHFKQYHTRSRAVYLTILALLVAAFIAMCIIRVEVSVHSSGILRAGNERSVIRVPVEGRIDSLFVTENMHVQEGQVLFKIRSHAVDEQTMLVNAQSQDLQAQLHDLEQLVNGHGGALQSTLYRQQYQTYQQKMAELQQRYAQVKRSYTRYKTLFDQKVVAAAEYEKYEADLQNTAGELQLSREQQFSEWQGELASIRQQYQQIEAKQSMYTHEKEYYTVRAVTSGSVQQLKGIQAGSYVAVNEELGEISPDSGLIAEVYVMPKDIGLLRKGTPVNVQIDAYNYNEWGLLGGRVVAISNDVFMDNRQPYFKVRCALEHDFLQLHSGYKGVVKKGMTAQVRFHVTKRTLYQLLYDKTDDWLNPNLQHDETALN
ncbi:HlyD family secretion protein [Chitinophaga costaii]|uniref:HlyD family secretion protein n=1 Tax=Chitinophaga costaii TaxID=1335309 RepID=A0A1C4AX32_9BACT|nr:HlyD family efflux transporter periplasmic adaptor subunit [Chitinophaga costaii]PUZ26781.1 secretion protein HlyD [Chitinophaga costaii]SCB99116.1 HlyD family secretion protein [Chitinophaga costaii]